MFTKGKSYINTICNSVMTYRIHGRDPVLLVDVDGVIADTPQEESWQRTMQEHGWIVSGNFKTYYQHNLAGGPREQGIKKILEQFAPEKKEDLTAIKEFSDAKQAHFEKLIEEGKFRIYDDVRRLVVEAKEREIAMAVCSSSENSKKLLEHIYLQEKSCSMYEMFDIVIAGAKSHGASKKSVLYNMTYGLLLNKKTFNNPFIIVLEDADVGVEAAKEAGFYCVGIARPGLTTPRLLRMHGADIAYNQRQLNSLDFNHLASDLEKLVAA